MKGPRATVRAVRQWWRNRLPRRVTIREFDRRGCRFEVTTPTEVKRVVYFGGERDFTHVILNGLRPDDVVFDIGSCVGLVSIHAARRCHQVVAFEPDPAYRLRLERNLRLNGLTNVRVEAYAISDTEGDTILYTDGVDGASASLGADNSRGQVPVRTITLDEYARSTRLTPDAIKLDIEGAEILALRGSQKLLASPGRPRRVFLEIHPNFLPTFGATVEEVVALVERHGYRRDYQARRANQIHVVYSSPDS